MKFLDINLIESLSHSRGYIRSKSIKNSNWLDFIVQFDSQPDFLLVALYNAGYEIGKFQLRAYYSIFHPGTLTLRANNMVRLLNIIKCMRAIYSPLLSLKLFYDGSEYTIESPLEVSYKTGIEVEIDIKFSDGLRIQIN